MFTLILMVKKLQEAIDTFIVKNMGDFGRFLLKTLIVKNLLKIQCYF